MVGLLQYLILLVAVVALVPLVELHLELVHQEMVALAQLLQ
jgi:hypothetical protein